jgi:transglutaminase-like putative cysteine protease
VSSTTQVAVLAPLGHEAGSGRHAARSGERPVVRLVAFAALGLYGVLRWGTLMSPAPTWRLLGVLALAVALTGVAPVLLEREREVATRAGRAEPVSVVGAPLAVLAFIAMFPLAGVPLAWVVHLRVAVTANGIGQGLSVLPNILVPYSGFSEWARTVMVLGAAVLLLDAAMLLAFAPPALGDVRRAGAALPLIALVVVPAVSLHPHAAYLQGLILFALLALFMWGERVPSDRRGGVILACAMTGAIGMIAAPAIDQNSPWINTHQLAGGLSPAHVDRFDWSQRYGPLNWPHSGTNVFSVAASPSSLAFSGEYWKTENLDDFNGTGWASGGVGSGTGEAGISARTRTEFTQTLTVSITGMSTSQVIAAGDAQTPARLTSPPQPAASSGTWTTLSPLRPGDVYTVRVYVPHPSPSRLAQAGEAYPADVVNADLSLSVPTAGASANRFARTVQFPAYGSDAPARLKPTGPGLGVAPGFNGVITSSPYWPAYQEAQRLLRGSRTPYVFVERVLSYLSPVNGFTYYTNPPRARYPLASFLVNKLGYCQQFAGAMALLLRMGGVPARVATGFTTGNYDSATKRWLVTDIDAHAWVEAWFPHYGWVTFDPTPAADPALGGHQSVAGFGAFDAAGLPLHPTRGAEGPSGVATGATAIHAGGSDAPLLFGSLGVLLAVLAVGLAAWRRTGSFDAEALLAELERALRRSGRPISDGVTLAALERRFRTSPDAAAYVRTLRLARFGSGAALPTLRQRRALRAQLRAGLGLAGAVRALWALPPRPGRGQGPRKQSAASLN